MKKALLLIGIVFLFSCEKQSCKICTTTMTGGGYNSSATFEACGDDIKAVNGKVISSTASYEGITVTVTSQTTCK